MKIRRAIISTLALGAVLAPSVAIADDVHITIGSRHVTRDGDRKLKISGDLHLVGAPASCTDNRDLVIQRRRNSGADWKRIARDSSSGTGHYAKVVRDRQGQYRVVATAAGSCEKDTSAVEHHHH